MTDEISFAPFTLLRIKDRGGIVHFEFNEVEGDAAPLKIDGMTCAFPSGTANSNMREWKL
jgi:hypothetical protein